MANSLVSSVFKVQSMLAVVGSMGLMVVLVSGARPAAHTEPGQVNTTWLQPTLAEPTVPVNHQRTTSLNQSKPHLNIFNGATMPIAGTTGEDVPAPRWALGLGALAMTNLAQRRLADRQDSSD